MNDLQLPKFNLSLLGRFELTGPDGSIDLPNKKLAGLLAYLACTQPTPQHRETGDAALGLAFRHPGAAESAPGPVPVAQAAGTGCAPRRRRRGFTCAGLHRLRCSPARGAD